MNTCCSVNTAYYLPEQPQLQDEITEFRLSLLQDKEKPSIATNQREEKLVIDFNQSDTAIAAQIGKPAYQVSQARKLLGLTACTTSRQSERNKAIQETIDALDTSNMTIGDIAKVADCTYECARFSMRRTGKPFLKKKRGRAGKVHWEKFPKNWENLTDHQLSIIVGSASEVGVLQWRQQHGLVRTRPPSGITADFQEDKNCPYYPCHDSTPINCVHCFCPLYDSDCKGNFSILKNGLKDCSKCMIPHSPEFSATSHTVEKP